MARDGADRPGRGVPEPIRRAPLARPRLVVVSPAKGQGDRQEVEPEPDGSLRLEVQVVGGGQDGGGVINSSVNSQLPLLLRVEDAARMLAISRGALYPLLGRDIPIVRIGRSVRIQSEVLRQFIADHVDRS